MAELEDYLDILNAAQVLHVHPETVKRLCRQGDIEAVKVHNTWLIRKDVLSSFAAGYYPRRGPGARFRRLREEAERFSPRQLRFDTEYQNRERD